MHENIDVHNRILIAEFPEDGIKCIEKLKSHCANMTFSDKSRYDRIFQQVTHKGGEYAMNCIRIPQNAEALSVSVGNSYSEYQMVHTFGKWGNSSMCRTFYNIGFLEDLKIQFFAYVH